MAEATETSHFLKDIFPLASAESLQLMNGAVENTMLLRSDFYAMRDLLDIANCSSDESAQAILLLLLIALEEGSLCIEIARPALLRRLRDLVPESDAAAWAQRIEHAIRTSGYPSLIGTSPNDQRAVVGHSVEGRYFLYFQKHLRAELDFQAELSRRLQPTSGAKDWRPIVDEVLGSQPLRLDRDQQLALGVCLVNDFAIISGGPGTGKTTIVLTLLRCLIRGGIAPERIAMAAPTGRAAQRLTDALSTGLQRLNTDAASPDLKLQGLVASTLHTLLGYRPSRNLFSRHRENLIPADVIIVDEASMVGVVMMSQLMQAASPETKLILLGDKNQLPSVEAGAVLGSLITDQHVNGLHADIAGRMSAIFPDLDVPKSALDGPLQNRIVLLRTNHRSQLHIREVADAVNQQDADLVDRLEAIRFDAKTDLDAKAGCWLIEQTAGTANELRGVLLHWAEQAYFRSRLQDCTLADLIDSIAIGDGADPTLLDTLFALLDRFRLLTLVRESAWGCEEINDFLDTCLRPRLDPRARGRLFAGAPVLITRNDPGRGLFNGDVGITVNQKRGGLCVLFPRPGGAAVFTAESLPPHELGFALTVHKSQGSEYDNVMIVVPPMGGRRLLTKELIYTGITRAKSLTVLYSTKEALRFAIGRKTVRESGMSTGG
jgi:exodeoxyribonuclease V alpha subunit